MKSKRYQVEMEFIRRLLATNPSDPAVMDTFIIERQRKLILDKSQINKELNKYLNAPPISEERGQAEIKGLIAKLEELVGKPLTEEQQVLVTAGRLEELMETFQDFEFRGLTVFFWNKELGRPMIGCHQIYGMLKAAAEYLGDRAGVVRKNGTVFHLSSEGKVKGSLAHTVSLINTDIRCESEFIVLDQDINRYPDGTPKNLHRSLRAKTAQGPRVSLARSEVVSAGAKLSFVLTTAPDSQITEDILNLLFSCGEWIGFGQWRNAGNGAFKHTLTEIKD